LDVKKRTAHEILGYKEATWKMLKNIWPQLKKLKLDHKIEKQIKVNCFYSRYTKRQITEIEELKKDAKLALKSNIDYNQCGGLSNEIKEILKRHKPSNIGEARELPGMTPAAAAILLRHLKK
jgi:tRNA uridine 5-carboxymethylaminomethyl modification enzyme